MGSVLFIVCFYTFLRASVCNSNIDFRECLYKPTAIFLHVPIFPSSLHILKVLLSKAL